MVEQRDLKIKRTDARTGWGQNLQYTCCHDTEDKEHPEGIELPIPSITMFTPHDDLVYTFDGLQAVGTFFEPPPRQTQRRAFFSRVSNFQLVFF